MKLTEHFVKLRCLQKLLALTTYILIGAAIFMKLEKTDEPNQVVANRILKAVQEDLSLQLGVNITDQQFLNAVENISGALMIQERHDWTYWRALDFVVVALTTIGYGDLVPRTSIGQGVFIIYALFGLPLIMVTLKYTGERLHICIRKLIVTVEKKVLGKQVHVQVKIKCFIFSLFMFFMFLVADALVVHHLNGDSFSTSLYTTFVTYSTIGFGDYRIRLDRFAKRYGNVAMTIMLVIHLPGLLFGLTIVACLLNTSVDLMEKARNRLTVRDSRNGPGENCSNQEKIAASGKTDH